MSYHRLLHTTPQWVSENALSLQICSGCHDQSKERNRDHGHSSAASRALGLTVGRLPAASRALDPGKAWRRGPCVSAGGLPPPPPPATWGIRTQTPGSAQGPRAPRLGQALKDPSESSGEHWGPSSKSANNCSFFRLKTCYLSPENIIFLPAKKNLTFQDHGKNGPNPTFHIHLQIHF